jgi:hypothetical protein
MFEQVMLEAALLEWLSVLGLTRGSVLQLERGQALG